MKKVLAITLIMLMVMSLFTFASATSPVELRFQRIGNDQPEADFWKWVIQGFEAANPGIKVVYDDAAIGEPMETKLNTLFASNAGPDIIGHGILSVASRVELGHYMPIDEYFATWEGKDDIMESVLANGTYKGKVYGLGYSVTPYIFAYRKDLFTEAGLDPEAPPTTWAQLREYALKLTKKDGDRITQAGFVFPMKGGNMVEYDTFVFGNGGKFMDDQSIPTLDTPEKVEVFNFLSELLPQVNVPYDNNENNPFIKGNAAMTLINNVALRPLLNNPDFAGKIGIALPPYNTNPGTFSGCNMLFIGSGCKNPDAAMKFIEYSLSSEVALERSRLLNIPVTRKSLVDEFVAMDPYNAVRIQCVENGTGMPRATWATRFQTLRNEAVQSILYDGQDAAETLKKAQEALLEEIE